MTDRCREASSAAGEALPGTAPTAAAWIVLEHPGPWGARALVDGALPAPISAHLLAGREHGVSTLLARRPQRRANAAAGHRAWIARSTPGGTLLRQGELADLDDVLDWDLAAIGRGELPPFGQVSTRPVHFICTNGARDQCCAIDGRELLTSLLRDQAGSPAAAGDDIWECSHIGGHRLAPVMLTLPSGAVHGRMSSAQARDVITLADQGEILLTNYRGRSGLASPLQAAAIAARSQFDIPGIDDIDVLVVRGDRVLPVSAVATDVLGEHLEVEVRHVDGRAWRADVDQRTSDATRPESCGAVAAPITSWVCSPLVSTPSWR